MMSRFIVCGPSSGKNRSAQRLPLGKSAVWIDCMHARKPTDADMGLLGRRGGETDGWQDDGAEKKG
jgi:hypothetical protein